jgi:AraC-like DNA-binding protein
MLAYLAVGQRTFGDSPSPIIHRPYWEFMIVTRGVIGMVTDQGPDFLSRSSLWLTRPGHLHGWIGEKGKTASVLVFHFPSIPETLLRSIPADGCLKLSLEPGQIKRLSVLGKKIQKGRAMPDMEILIREEHLLLELSILVHDLTETEAGRVESVALEKVEKAITWFGSRLASNPSVEEVGRAVGLSVSQLRRNFQEILRQSPKKVFDQLRFQRAIQLMTDTGMKLSTVAESCGFDSLSAFSRAFKGRFGISPEHWRGRPSSLNRRN